MASPEFPRPAFYRLIAVLWLFYIASLLGIIFSSIWYPKVLGSHGTWIIFALFALRFALPRISKRLIGDSGAKP